MRTFLTIIGGIAGVIVAIVVWLIYAASAGGRRAHQHLVARIAPVADAIGAGRDPVPSDLLTFAGEPAPHGRGTFSRFESYDSRTPEEHVAVTHKAVIERKG